MAKAFAKKNNDGKSQVFHSQIGRVSFPAVFERSDFTGKYELNLVWGPDTDLSALEDAIESAIKAEWPTNRPRRIKTPLKDIEEKPNLGDFPEGSRFARFWRNTPPIVKDAKKELIAAEDDELYAGCYARVAFNVFAGTNKKGGPYVSLGLIQVQKVTDGERLGGGGTPTELDAADDFDDLPEDLASLLVD